MNGFTSFISATELHGRLGTAAAPVVVDVRRTPTFAQADRLIVSAFHRDPERVATWLHELPRNRPVAVYCAHGLEVGQDTATALRAAGIDAVYVEGGIEAWESKGLPTRRKIGAGSGKWVTRERPKIDRIACPWLIRRFVDPDAAFFYVPAPQVKAYALETGATPYDIDGVEFSHEGERCSFDTMLRIFDIRDPALDRLATIVRGADTARLELAPQCAGLLAVSLGLSANFTDDHAMLAHGMVVYDALYTWCRSLQAESHNWPARASA